MPRAKGDVVGRWQPQQMRPGEERVTLQWDASGKIKRAGLYGVVLDYEKGQDGVYIQSVVILEDGKEIARDEHLGWTGAADKDNHYRLRVPAVKAGAKYVVQALMYIPDGGTDSAGCVDMTRLGD